MLFGLDGAWRCLQPHIRKNMKMKKATLFNKFKLQCRLKHEIPVGLKGVKTRFLINISFLHSGITTIMAVYRGKTSMYEYILAGVATGSMYKFNMGLRGMAAGGIVGGFLGTVAGGISVAILKSTGMTMEEVRYWQYKWRSTRDNDINDSFKKQLHDRYDMWDEHDKKIGSASNLDIKTLPEPRAEKVEQVKSEDKTKAKTV